MNLQEYKKSLPSKIDRSMMIDNVTKIRNLQDGLHDLLANAMGVEQEAFSILDKQPNARAFRSRLEGAAAVVGWKVPGDYTVNALFTWTQAVSKNNDLSAMDKAIDEIMPDTLVVAGVTHKQLFVIYSIDVYLTYIKDNINIVFGYLDAMKADADGIEDFRGRTDKKGNVAAYEAMTYMLRGLAALLSTNFTKIMGQIPDTVVKKSTSDLVEAVYSTKAVKKSTLGFLKNKPEGAELTGWNPDIKDVTGPLMKVMNKQLIILKTIIQNKNQGSPKLESDFDKLDAMSSKIVAGYRSQVRKSRR